MPFLRESKILLLEFQSTNVADPAVSQLRDTAGYRFSSNMQANYAAAGPSAAARAANDGPSYVS